jgi:hypothetical protein
MDGTASNEGAVGEEPTRAFARRASIVFLLDAVLIAIGIGVVAAAGGVTGPGAAITLALAGVTACAALVLAVALRRHRAWAPATGRVVLWAILLLGCARTVIAFRSGSIQIPIDSILAGWALLAPGLPPIWVRTMRVPGALLAAVLLIGEVGATVIVPAKQGAGQPPSDPARAIRITNLSPHAVLVSAGGLLSNETAQRNEVVARPCGGIGTLFVGPADLTDDGRLMVFLTVDPTGGLDAALAAYAGDPADLPGDFSLTPIWSRGDLADRLPVQLTVAPDETVAETTPAPDASAPACVPAH